MNLTYSHKFSLLVLSLGQRIFFWIYKKHTHQFFLSCECGQAWYQFYILQAEGKEIRVSERWKEMVTPRSSTQYPWTDPKAASLVRLTPGFFFCTLTLMTPGQLGPISLVFPWRSILCLTRTMSCCGIPSVMHTTKGISASTASSMAAAAKGGGT